MRKKFVSLVNSGVQLIVLPALNDDGAPSYDKGHAEFLASIGVPTFACTPDKFPDLMAAALSKQDIGMWVSQNVKSEGQLLDRKERRLSLIAKDSLS